MNIKKIIVIKAFMLLSAVLLSYEAQAVYNADVAAYIEQLEEKLKNPVYSQNPVEAAKIQKEIDAYKSAQKSPYGPNTTTTIQGRKPVWSDKRPKGQFNIWSFEDSFMKLVNYVWKDGKSYPVLWKLYKRDPKDPNYDVLLAEYLQRPMAKKGEQQQVWYIFHNENFTGSPTCITKIEAYVDPNGENFYMNIRPSKTKGWCKEAVKPFGAGMQTGFPGWRVKVFYDAKGKNGPGYYYKWDTESH